MSKMPSSSWGQLKHTTPPSNTTQGLVRNLNSCLSHTRANHNTQSWSCYFFPMCHLRVSVPRWLATSSLSIWTVTPYKIWDSRKPTLQTRKYNRNTIYIRINTKPNWWKMRLICGTSQTSPQLIISVLYTHAKKGTLILTEWLKDLS